MRLTVTRSLIVAATMLVSCATFAQAAKVQGFESGDPAVTSTGDAGKVGSFQGQAAPEGTMQYLLTTIGSMSNEDGLTSQSGSFAVINMSLQNFFGLSLVGTEGSGVMIPFSVSAGDTQLTLQYDFLSNEVIQSMPRDDFAFAAIFNSANALQGSALTFAKESTSTFQLFGNQSIFQFHTGLQTLSLSVASLAPGNYTLGLGIEDRTTADHASGLLIDNVQVVPEPSVMALALAGAGLLVGWNRRRRRA